MGIVFDLDQTLIDTSIAMELRRKRDWRKVYDLIPEFQVYNGIDELLNYISEEGIQIGIVTNSPRPYYNKILHYFGWDIKYSVCYHDTKRHKPDPEPIIRVIKMMDIKIDEAIIIGDDYNDIIAAKNAGAISVAALWGAKDKGSLLDGHPDYICDDVSELRLLIDALCKIVSSNG